MSAKDRFVELGWSKVTPEVYAANGILLLVSAGSHVYSQPWGELGERYLESRLFLSPNEARMGLMVSAKVIREKTGMRRIELDSWLSVTKLSEMVWICDRVTLHNRSEYLLYKGGENGIYLRITKEGQAEMGFYEGALPHIGEAIFMPRFSKKVGESHLSALSAISRVMNLPELLNYKEI